MASLVHNSIQGHLMLCMEVVKRARIEAAGSLEESKPEEAESEAPADHARALRRKGGA